MLPVVALVGRPNVGKSALFNRLVRKRVAIVHDTPLGHVTRDYQEGRAVLGDVEFLAVDTSGLEVVMRDGIGASGTATTTTTTTRARLSTVSKNTESINMRATRLTEGILRQSDVVLFLLDGKDGVTAVDRDLARWFRRVGGRDMGSIEPIVGKIVPVVNKCEGGGGRGQLQDVAVEVGRLGFNGGEYVGVSAETGEGMADLYAALQDRLDAVLRARHEGLASLGDEVGGEGGEGGEGGDRPSRQHPKIAIMGLTNVGKSTLLNRLVGHDRCVTGPEPGLTRDAISVEVRDDAGVVVGEFIDTAGWIRRTRLKAHDDSDGAVAAATMREGKTVMRFAHVVLLIVDCVRAMEALERAVGVGAASAAGGELERHDVLSHAESALVADAVGQGRAVIVGLNKVDMLDNGGSNGLSRHVKESRVTEAIRQSLRRVAPELGDSAAILPLSATLGAGVDDIMPSIQKVYETWNARVPTAKLNSWLRELKLEKAHVGGGNTVSRIKYLSQVKSRPPTFVAFLSGKTKLGEHDRRFVANRLRDDFQLSGVPVRVIQRSSR